VWVPDASRAVGVAHPAAEPGASRGLRRRQTGRLRRVRERTGPRRGQAPRVDSSPRRAATASRSTGPPTSRRCRAAGLHVFEDYDLAMRLAELHRLDAVLPWELAGRYPEDPRGRSGRRGARNCSPMRRRCCAHHRRRSGCARGGSACSRPTAGGRHRGVHRRVAHEGPRPPSTSCASRPTSRRDRANLCLADFVAPKRRG
jgi:cobalamin-dependent methionine synthase I